MQPDEQGRHGPAGNLLRILFRGGHQGIEVIDLILSHAEIQALTGYKAPTMQLEALRKDGFWRARIGRSGVILERSHYLAVSRGEVAQTAPRKVANLSHLRPA